MKNFFFIAQKLLQHFLSAGLPSTLVLSASMLQRA